MHRKTAGPSVLVGFGFKPLLDQSQRTRPGTNLDDDSPDQRKHVEYR